MPTTSVIPGVSVRTVFEPAPVLAGATGILGIVGITDRGPVDPTPVGSFAEFLETFGAASRFTMPELRSAFGNGVARAVVARVAPGTGTKASLILNDDEGEQVVKLVARAEGAWGNRISVRVTQVRTLSGAAVKYVNLQVLLDGRPAEPPIERLVMSPDDDNYLFDQINERSRLLVAVDPRMEFTLPSALAATPLDTSGARAAFATLKKGAAGVATATAKRRGRLGNRLSVQVTDGRASLPLLDSAGGTALTVRARTPGTDGTNIRVTVENPSASTARLTIAAGGSSKTTPEVSRVGDLVSALATDPNVIAEASGPASAPLPIALAATPLARTVDVTVFQEGADPRRHRDIDSLDTLVATDDPAVSFGKVAAATDLPDVDSGTPLVGGRDEGPALTLADDAGDPVVELRAVAGVSGALAVQVVHAVSTIDSTTPVANLTITADGQPAEVFTDLTMDPDDERYLPVVLGDSALLRATDLFVPSRTTSTPAAIPRATPLTGGTSPLTDDYQAALERLETSEEPDLVIASVAGQFTADDVRHVQQQVVAHCTKMADLARNRIGIGSITPDEQADVRKTLDHADDVRSDHFALCTPAGSEGAFAGLLAHLDYFDSATFKTVAALDGDPVHVTDAQLEQLITGNVLAITQRRGLGVIVAKALLTSGRQVNVQRTADKAVRDVKAVAQVYIGRLNNEGSRNALLQQVSALLTQMTRDGALVPSTDGTSPPFTVDVHSTQADFANGIVRVDIAIRPVRAIDYINATILVQN